MSTPSEFLETVTRRIADEAYDYCLPNIPSTTLQSALTILVPDPAHAAIFLTYYWALYVHDGRMPFTHSTIMCWFRNPADDPRLNAGITPARVSQLRHLSAGEFNYWMRENRKAERAVYGRLRRAGERQVGPMIVTKEIRTPTQAQRFFDNDKGMAGFSDLIGPIVMQMMSDYITKDALRDIINLRVPLKAHFVSA